SARLVREVHIDDLRAPRRSQDERALYEAALAMRVELTADGIVEEARSTTGLSDLGDETLRDRLAVQVAAVEADGGLSGLGRYIIRRRMMNQIGRAHV